MDAITIKNTLETPDGWQFTVILGSGEDSTQHKVLLSKDYWQYLTKATPQSPPSNKEGRLEGKMTPEQLIIKSFEFLLAREDKESILRTFNLPMIGTFYGEYEKEIGQKS